MEDRKLYEICFWLKDKGDDSVPQEDLKKIVQAISVAGGVIVSEKPLEKKGLAYPVKKQKVGFWGEIQFSGEPKILEAIRKSLQYEDEILRKMILEIKKAKKIKKVRTPSAAKILRKQEAANPETTKKEDRVQVSEEVLDTKLKEILDNES